MLLKIATMLNMLASFTAFAMGQIDKATLFAVSACLTLGLLMRQEAKDKEKS
jgi:hypothetical protein